MFYLYKTSILSNLVFYKTILSLDSQRSFLVALEFGETKPNPLWTRPGTSTDVQCSTSRAELDMLLSKLKGWIQVIGSVESRGLVSQPVWASPGGLIWGYDMMCFKQMGFESVKMLYKKDVKAKNQLDSLKNHHAKALGETRERVCLVSADPGAIIVIVAGKPETSSSNFDWSKIFLAKRYRKRIFPWDWHHYIQVRPQDLMKATGAVKFCFFSGCPVG